MTAPDVGGWTGLVGHGEGVCFGGGELGRRPTVSTGLARSHSGLRRADALPWKQAWEARVEAGGDSGFWTSRVDGGGERRWDL